MALYIQSGQNFRALNNYLKLPQNNKIQVEYIWIGGNGELRAKTKTINKQYVKSIKEIPTWSYDGSSTNQATGNDSEVFLKPIKIVPDPFRGGNNLLCLCESLEAKSMNPLSTNNRANALKIFENKSVKEEEPWYGIEQEYTLFDSNGSQPLGFPSYGFPAPQGPYYCSVGSKYAVGRQIAESHYRACLYAGLEISGINAEVMPGQWEFQIGPCIGIDSGDQLWLARYILQRVAEDFGAVISYEPKPVKGDWNGAGAHTNYSTKSMRNEGGYKYIIEAVQKLEKKHNEHMIIYGIHNKERLTGKHETAKFNEFKYGVADRGASIRIPRQSEIDNKGYLEDRRPAANMDPYLVTSMIAKTTIISQIYPIEDNHDNINVDSKDIEQVNVFQSVE